MKIWILDNSSTFKKEKLRKKRFNLFVILQYKYNLQMTHITVYSEKGVLYRQKSMIISSNKTFEELIFDMINMH